MQAYLDHAATSPLRADVLAAMRPHLEGPVANPSSTHAAGRAARAAVEDARDRVAEALGVAPLDVLFTSGGTEADNVAVKGIAWAAREARGGDHLVVTAIEHHAVLDAARWMGERQGFAVDVVPPERDGVVDPDRVLAAVGARTALVAVMAANNELGTVQPLEVLGPALAERGVALHADAVQAIGRMPIDVAGWRLASVALSAHKVGGPRGCGVLVLQRDVAAEPLLHGGGQERGVRSGTVDVAGAVGCGAAVALAVHEQALEAPRLARLRDRLEARLLDIPGATRNGAARRRLPSHCHVGFAGVDGEALLLALDAAGVAASSGSACASGAAEPSHVLRACGIPTDRAQLRFTIGRPTGEDEVDHAADATEAAVQRLRAAGGGFA